MLSPTLQALAEARAALLSEEPNLRLPAADLCMPYGENLHRCRQDSPYADAFKTWCRKDYARKNIYSRHAGFTGVGVVKAEGYVNIVMMFTTRDPYIGDESELGSAGIDTFVSATVLSDQEVIIRTDGMADKENYRRENCEVDCSVTGNTHNLGGMLMPENKALDIAQDAFNYMNGARKEIDVHYLRWDDGLYKQALAHTERIFQLGRQVHSRGHRFENVAVIDLESLKNAGILLMEKLLRRRENMLSSSFRYCAIAVVGDEKKCYATQLFSKERV